MKEHFISQPNKYLGLYTDFYELTMAQGFFLNGKADTTANFDCFFRRNPFESGYTIFAGLYDLIESILDFRYDSNSIDYLFKLGFKDNFIDYLKNFYFKGNIYAPDEGEIIFPNEPFIRFEGNIIETQLLESITLNILNFESLIATKASRLRYSAGNRKLADFGLRRAQALAAVYASRAAIIGGVDSTSNVISSYLYDLIPTGTQAHSWIQSFDNELTAFRKYAESFPENCVLLIDTYNTLKSGLPNAITVAKELEKNGHRLSAIRLDSGDLAYLSKKARKVLDEAGLYYVKIIASNQLDEYLIKSLIDQGAPIDSFGIGTSLITGQKDASLDLVYKISSVNDNPTIKISEDVNKITLPGKKKILRCFNGNEKFYADCIVLEKEDKNKIDLIFHPHNPNKKSSVKNFTKENIISKVFENGSPLQKQKSTKEIADYVQFRLTYLPEEHKRFEFPHTYKVGLSKKLMDLRDELVKTLGKEV
jgi:nicotinate phosphoribosyltransferase